MRRSAVPGDPGLMKDAELVTSGLRFPEGPVALADGSLLVVEVRGGTITKIDPDGEKDIVAECGGGPSGLAVGPDGRIYVCNDGRGDEYTGGRIERVDIDSGTVDVLYESCDGRRLSSPNDLVFDDHGGFYFTDYGKMSDHAQDKGSLLYAQPDGSRITRVSDPLFPMGVGAPNGIALSSDQRILYFVETFTGRLYGRRLKAPGELDPDQSLDDAFVYGTNALEWFDGIAIDSEGSICVATLRSGRITVISADGETATQVSPPTALHDPMVTNLCFGGPDLTTLYVTLASTGTVVKCTWDRPGLPLSYQDQTSMQETSRP